MPDSPSRNHLNNIQKPSISYYEQCKKDLRDLLKKRRTLDENLLSLEEQIYKLERKYLEETAPTGNIVRGFDNFLRGSANKKRSEFSENDRIFSLSSTTYLEAISATRDEESTGKPKKRNKVVDDDNDIDSDGKEDNQPPKRIRISLKT